MPWSRFSAGRGFLDFHWLEGAPFQPPPSWRAGRFLGALCAVRQTPGLRLRSSSSHSCRRRCCRRRDAQKKAFRTCVCCLQSKKSFRVLQMHRQRRALCWPLVVRTHTPFSVEHTSACRQPRGVRYPSKEGTPKHVRVGGPACSTTAIGGSVDRHAVQYNAVQCKAYSATAIGGSVDRRALSLTGGTASAGSATRSTHTEQSCIVCCPGLESAAPNLVFKSGRYAGGAGLQACSMR